MIPSCASKSQRFYIDYLRAFCYHKYMEQNKKDPSDLHGTLAFTICMVLGIGISLLIGPEYMLYGAAVGVGVGIIVMSIMRRKR